ncbi:MAG: hypothetical protein ACRBF0_19890 [Calditrichia bacterium]
MNGEKAAANAIRRVIDSWASEQGEERKQDVEQVKGYLGIDTDVCRSCKTGPHKDLIDGQCEWCSAGGYTSEDIERQSDYTHIL